MSGAGDALLVNRGVQAAAPHLVLASLLAQIPGDPGVLDSSLSSVTGLERPLPSSPLPLLPHPKLAGAEPALPLPRALYTYEDGSDDLKLAASGGKNSSHASCLPLRPSSIVLSPPARLPATARACNPGTLVWPVSFHPATG